MRIVHHVTFHKLRVWYNDRNIVERLNFSRTNIYFGYISLNTCYIYAVTHAYWALEHNDESRDEICSNILQAKTDTHREQSKNNGQAGEVNPHKLKGDQEADYDNYVLRNAGKRLL